MAIYIKGSVVGKSETREFEFRVLKRSAQLGLPQSAIDALGLSKVPGLPRNLRRDNDGPIYLSRVDFAEGFVHQYVASASEPTIGADTLRALGYKVDLEQEHIAKPTEPLKIQRGLMPTMLDVRSLVMTETTQFVCADCIDDSGIATFIADNAKANYCSFCPAKGTAPIGARLDEVGEYVNLCLKELYGDAVDELPWDGEEEEYFGYNWDTYELLTDVVELHLPNDYNGSLLDALVDRVDDITWCEKNGLGLNDQEHVIYSWRHFCNVVTRERRFFFTGYGPDPSEPDVYDPGQVLDSIFEFASELGLFNTLPQGTRLYRARWEGSEVTLRTAQELGPPPQHKAVQANRMSPPGIVMFYACDEIETALLEVAQQPGRLAVGQWEILRPAIVLDLTDIPALPGIFEYDPSDSRYPNHGTLTFIRHIADQISRPIDRDDRIHVEYVPTQVVTEFLRAQERWEGRRIDGIKYVSSLHPNHASYVLFANQAHVLTDPPDDQSEKQRWPEEKPWLKLVSVSHHQVNLAVAQG